MKSARMTFTSASFLRLPVTKTTEGEEDEAGAVDRGGDDELDMMTMLRRNAGKAENDKRAALLHCLTSMSCASSRGDVAACWTRCGLSLTTVDETSRVRLVSVAHVAGLFLT
jgi:hypothetical protein